MSAPVSQYRVAVCSRGIESTICVASVSRTVASTSGESRRRDKPSSPSLRISGLCPRFARYPKLSSRRPQGLLRGVAPSIQGQSRINADASCRLPRVLWGRGSTYRKYEMSRQVYLRLQAAVLFGVFLLGARFWTAVWPALQNREYATCMRLARVSPHEGFEAALTWIDAGGGGAAKHCAAVALFSMYRAQIRGSISRFGPQHWLQHRGACGPAVTIRPSLASGW